MDVANVPPAEPSWAVDLVGYLNFSDGRYDPQFYRGVDAAYHRLAADAGSIMPVWRRFGDWLKTETVRLQTTNPTFADCDQTLFVLAVVFGDAIPAYRQFHRDLLFHQTDDELFQPYFVARVCQTVLQEHLAGADSSEELVRTVVARLNDYIGHRPTAVLNNDRQLKPYDHEWVAPIPVYLEAAGLAHGRYRKLIEQALTILRDADPAVRDLAYFDPNLLSELAIDPRSYDFDHPVNKRPNYHFGQWDPHQIDNRGRYRRFVLQEVTLEAIWFRTHENSDLPPEELLYEAGAVLAGTVLMSSAVSGNGPDAHDSSVTLGTLLPRIVRCREEFYSRLLKNIPGPHGDRLRTEAETLHQPFAGARQHLNQRLAKLRAVQLQHVRLAQLFSQMGYADAARRQAQIVPVASARMLCEINGLMTTIHQLVDRGKLPQAAAAVPEAVELLHRAIECGALVDPWSILGFQGQFSLFPAMENSVRDHRVDVLTHLLKRLFALLVRLTGEAAAGGEADLRDHLQGVLTSLGSWWDRFAADEVSGVDPVHGADAVRSAEQVSEALGAWHQSGEATGDMTFWRKHVAHFTSSKTYALVIEALLDKRDEAAAMGLLMQWLGRSGEVPLVEGEFSFHALTQRWLNEVLSGNGDDAANSLRRRWDLLGKFFDYFEANADDWWQPPRFEIQGGNRRKKPQPVDDDQDADDEDDGKGLFGAAYEEVTFRDSTRDGNEGNTLSSGDDATEFELETEAQRLVTRLTLLETVAKLWKSVAVGIDAENACDRERTAAWSQQSALTRDGLLRLLDDVEAFPLPKPRGGSSTALVEYDRRRQVRDELLGRIIITCVETIDAARLLAAATGTMPEGTTPPAEWEGRFIEVVQALRSGDHDRLEELTPRLRALLNEQPILYVPLAKGGRPRDIVAAQSVQSAVSLLLQTLPRAGLPGETCRLVGVVQHMERHRPNGEGAVTEFDRMFQLGFDACAHSLIDSVEVGVLRPHSVEEEAQSSELFEGLQLLTEGLLRRWNMHARSLRLSSLEKASDKKRWEALCEFIRNYGHDLFKPKFLNLGNLRAVLYQRVEDWLTRLQDEDDEPGLKLVEDLDGKISKSDAAEFLTIIIETLIENYAEFKDYNSTTTQSDHGELLYVLLDFLRLRTAYERFAWNLRPVLMVHETLVRRHKTTTAELWRRALTDRTQEAADWHMNQLRELTRKHGVRLPTVADRLSERFVRPLAVDRLKALIRPAVTELQEDQQLTAFSLLEQELREFTDHPTGAGLDVPAWLSALEEEVRRVLAKTDRRAAEPATLADRIPRTTPVWEELLAQLRSWDTAG